MPDPLAPHRSAIQQLRWRAEQFLAGLPNRLSTGSSPLSTVQREAAAGIGGALSYELFGRRRLGSAVGRALVANSQSAQRQRAKEAVRAEAGTIVQLARQVVDSTSPILGPQTSQSLRRLLARADASNRADTAVRRVIEVVGRLESWRPTLPPQSKAEAYPESLRALERGLRKCIEARLSSLTTNWWLERIPPEVRATAEKRKAQRERVWPWLDGGEHALVEYLNFPDYAKVILDPQNWAQAFVGVFADQEALRVKLRELEPIRNDVAHSRDLTDANRARLRLYSEELTRQMTS